LASSVVTLPQTRLDPFKEKTKKEILQKDSSYLKDFARQKELEQKAITITQEYRDISSRFNRI